MDYFYPENSPELLARAVEAETRPINDPVGRVDGGHIRLEGPLCAVTLGNGLGPATLHLPSADQPLKLLELSFDDEASLRASTAGSHPLRLLGAVRKEDYHGTPVSGLVLQSIRRNDSEYIRVSFWVAGSWDGSHDEILDAFDSMNLDLKDSEAVDSKTSRYKINIPEY